MKRRSIKVLLVDDQALIREGLRRILEGEDDIEVVGECDSAENAFSCVEKVSPNVIVMDIHMPVMNGIEATRHLKKNGFNCNADIVLLAESAEHMVESLEAGAAGYFIWGMNTSELPETIRQVYQNEHSIEEGGNPIDETVELVIPSCAGVWRTSRFIDEVGKTLDVSVLQTVGSWKEGTVVTVIPKNESLPDLMDRLYDVPGVEKAEEDRSGVEGLSNFFKKFRMLRGSRINHKNNRILVTLN